MPPSVEGKAQGRAVSRQPGLGRSVIFQAMALSELWIEDGAAVDVGRAQRAPGAAKRFSSSGEFPSSEHVPAVTQVHDSGSEVSGTVVRSQSLR